MVNQRSTSLQAECLGKKEERKCPVELKRYLTISSPKAWSTIKIKIAENERHCTLGGCVIAIFVVYSITSNMCSLRYLKKSIIYCVYASKYFEMLFVHDFVQGKRIYELEDSQ